MKKPPVLIILAILMSIFGLFGCDRDRDVSVGTVRLVSGGTQHEPLENFTQAYTHDVYADGRIKRPQDVVNELTAVPLSDDAGIQIRGTTKHPPTYTLYGGQYHEIYSNQEGFTIPDEPGRYILCVGVTWGIKNQQEYKVYQYFFMIEN